MDLQTSTTRQAPHPAPSRRVNPVVMDGLAAILSKARSVLLGERLRVWAEVSPEEQRDLILAAREAVHAQDPARSRRAIDLALDRAEAVIVEEGALATDQARHLARRIAAEAILTHRLALQGLFDQRAGGVQ